MEVYKSVRKSVIWSVKGPKGAKKMNFWLYKVEKRSIFFIDSYLKESAFTAVKRDAKF